LVDTLYFKIIYVILAYLLGSVLFSYVMTAIYGRGDKKDLYKIDRPGTAGVGRQFGIKAGAPTFFFDCGKGVAVVMVGKAIGLDDITIAAACVAVIVGHNWPVWYKFKGGGGLATGMGIAGSLMLIPFLIFLGISLLIGTIYRFTAGRKHKVNPNVIGGLIGAILFPVFIYLFGIVFEGRYFFGPVYDAPFVYLIMAIVLLLIIVTKGIILHFAFRNISTANRFDN
jgi:glycerol-3-phosphate acyltransferase PlsY